MESKIHPSEHTYFEMKQIIAALARKYPFINLSSIGRSVAGREIPCLAVGAATEYTLFITGDNPLCRITSLILLMFAEELCDKILNGKEMCGIDMRKAMFGRGIMIIPLLNPDGTELVLKGEQGCGYMTGKLEKLCNKDYKNWQANIRGIELIRNLHPNFEALKAEEKKNKIYGPAPKGFGGYKPDSEPESAAFNTFCRKKLIKKLIWLTSYGETVSYSANSVSPQKSAEIAEAMAAVSNFSIQPPIAKSNIELNDRFTYDFSRPGISVKIGKDAIPQVNELYFWYNRIKEMLILSSVI